MLLVRAAVGEKAVALKECFDLTCLLPCQADDGLDALTFQENDPRANPCRVPTHTAKEVQAGLHKGGEGRVVPVQTALEGRLENSSVCRLERFLLSNWGLGRVM